VWYLLRKKVEMKKILALVMVGVICILPLFQAQEDKGNARVTKEELLQELRSKDPQELQKYLSEPDSWKTLIKKGITAEELEEIIISKYAPPTATPLLHLLLFVCTSLEELSDEGDAEHYRLLTKNAEWTGDWMDMMLKNALGYWEIGWLMGRYGQAYWMYHDSDLPKWTRERLLKVGAEGLAEEASGWEIKKSEWPN
jgi:hypothetical protein